MDEGLFCLHYSASNEYFYKHFHNVKNRKISGAGGEKDIYNFALKEYEAAKSKPFPIFL